MITYLRTDSTRISQEADAAAREYIGQQYGEEYVSVTEKSVKKEQKIQDAHEAIRPTDITRTAGNDQGISFQRPVPSVSADLETFYCQQNGSSQI